MTQQYKDPENEACKQSSVIVCLFLFFTVTYLNICGGCTHINILSFPALTMCHMDFTDSQHRYVEPKVKGFTVTGGPFPLITYSEHMQ